MKIHWWEIVNFHENFIIKIENKKNHNISNIIKTITNSVNFFKSNKNNNDKGIIDNVSGNFKYDSNREKVTKSKTC